ncbi:MAG: hypothetical protein Q9M39_04485 [Sulfurovum sp.]|nr:hypothetical protein [Sulfurovum sp.]
MINPKIQRLVESSKFQNFIMGLIVLNGITMGFETSKSFSLEYGTFLHFSILL